ncbi:hypothetical protein DV736_g6355, partial [Chaetothyriales sp. CBS 134916]
MSRHSDSPSGSQYLSSSHHSLTHSKKASSEISKTYKHASELYLTRQLAEAYDALQFVIKPPPPDDDSVHDGGDAGDALLSLISSASTSQRIKVWSLYAALLNAIVDLGPEEGKQAFSQKKYRDLVRLVQSGDVWEQVVNDGYRGREESVDAEVVYNLSTLLLNKAQTQTLNQTRLETYLSSSQPTLDISAQLSQSLNGHRSHMNGTSTPKDLHSRIKIIELFTLHVLPAVGEWDYARSFVSNSDILDDERREAFLQTLAELQEAKEQEEVVFDDAVEDYTHDGTANPTTDKEYTNGTARAHHRTSSEIDYGIEKALPNSGRHSPESPPATTTPPQPPPQQREDSAKTSLPPPQLEPTRSSRQGPQSASHSQPSPPSRTPRRPGRRPTSKTQQQNTLTAQARHLFATLSNLARNLAGSLTANPTTLLSMLMFLLAFLIAFSRREVRERLKLVLGKAWDKVRRTVGMGVKVSYI